MLVIKKVKRRFLFRIIKILSKQSEKGLKSPKNARKEVKPSLDKFHYLFGRGDGIRTHDLMVPNHARYQLRYASIWLFS